MTLTTSLPLHVRDHRRAVDVTLTDRHGRVRLEVSPDRHWEHDLDDEGVHVTVPPVTLTELATALLNRAGTVVTPDASVTFTVTGNVEVLIDVPTGTPDDPACERVTAVLDPTGTARLLVWVLTRRTYALNEIAGVLREELHDAGADDQTISAYVRAIRRRTINPGVRVDVAADQMVCEAERSDGRVDAAFNGTPLIAYPTDDGDMVTARWSAIRDRYQRGSADARDTVTRRSGII